MKILVHTQDLEQIIRGAEYILMHTDDESIKLHARTIKGVAQIDLDTADNDEEDGLTQLESIAPQKNWNDINGINRTLEACHD